MGIDRLTPDQATALFLEVSDTRHRVTDIALELGMSSEEADEVYVDDDWRDAVMNAYGGAKIIGTSTILVMDEQGTMEVDAPVVGMPGPCLDRMLSAALVIGYVMGRRSQ